MVETGTGPAGEESATAPQCGGVETKQKASAHPASFRSHAGIIHLPGRCRYRAGRKTTEVGQHRSDAAATFQLDTPLTVPSSSFPSS